MTSRLRHTLSAPTYTPCHDTMLSDIGYEHSTSQAMVDIASYSNSNQNYFPSPPSSASPSPLQHKNHPRYLPCPWDTSEISPRDEYREPISPSDYSHSSSGNETGSGGFYNYDSRNRSSSSRVSDALSKTPHHDDHASSNIYDHKRPYYEDFVLYPSSSQNWRVEKVDSKYRESSRSKFRGEPLTEKEYFGQGRLADGNPPMAPRLPSLPTPEIRDFEELYGEERAEGAMGHMGYAYDNYNMYDVHAYGDGQVGWLTPAKEGMFPEL